MQNSAPGQRGFRKTSDSGTLLSHAADGISVSEISSAVDFDCHSSFMISTTSFPGLRKSSPRKTRLIYVCVGFIYRLYVKSLRNRPDHSYDL